MKKLYAIGLIATAAVIIGLAWAEQLTFSTYYPAPAGVYNQMVTRCLGVGDQDGDGLNYADAPDPSISGQENDLWVAGSVGIGTTNPQTELEVRSTDGIAAIRLFENSLGESEGDFEIRAVQSPANDRLDFYTAYNSATLMSLEKRGNVGIGTTSPGRPLEVKGVVKTQAALLDPVNPNSISNPEDGMIACDDGFASGDTNVIKQYDAATAQWNPLSGMDTALLSRNGYTILPSGLIMQWGRTALVSDPSHVYTQTIAFPMTFPNAVFSVTATLEYHTSTYAPKIVTGSITNSNFQFAHHFFGGGGPYRVNWIATGH